MLSFLTFICRLILHLARSKKDLLLQLSLQQKEIEILKRKHRDRRVKFRHSDRVVFAVLNTVAHLRERFSIVKPETVLAWQRQLIKHFWTFKKHGRVGRPPVGNDIKQLILTMKNDNLYWGYKRIQGELLKLDINLDKKTIRNILSDFRRRGKIKLALTWKQFLNMQMQSIYAMDFFTIDTLLNQRLYVFFIIYHQTREIAHVAISRNPCREFVRQQLIEFGEQVKNLVYLIHDNAAQFNLDYLAYGMKGIRTSLNSPNINAIAERFIGSLLRESLDYFLLINERQILNLLTEYIHYYNTKRPHQGLDQEVPIPYKPQRQGRVRKTPILGGLCYHYERIAA